MFGEHPDFLSHDPGLRHEVASLRDGLAGEPDELVVGPRGGALGRVGGGVHFRLAPEGC